MNNVTTSQPSYSYVKTIGNAAAPGQIGFRNPVSVALGNDDLLYVLSHAAENVSNNKRIAKFRYGSEDFIGEFGSLGSLDGEFIWPNSLVVDSAGNVYVTDEWLNRISVFDPDGRFLHCWGRQGTGSGEWSRPAGLVFDHQQNLLVADSFNHRIQKFTKDGKYLSEWGSLGDKTGQFNTPWGISIDMEGNVFVADWRNDRIQKFTSDGNYLMQIGGSGEQPGEFHRPSGVAIDNTGYIYVVDWGNDRVQVFDSNGKFITLFTGDAGMSKWGEDRLSSNPEHMIEQRQQVLTMDPEKHFVQPVDVVVDRSQRIIIVDSARHRLQVYQRCDK